MGATIVPRAFRILIPRRSFSDLIGKGEWAALGTALALLAKPGLFDDWVMAGLIALTALATVASGVQYIYRGLIWLQNKAPSITRVG